MLTVLPSRCDRPLIVSRANAHTVVAVFRSAAGSVTSTRAVATVVLVVPMIRRRYLLPAESVITMASLMSVGGVLVDGNWKMALLAVIVSVSDGRYVLPVTVTVVAVVFVPS